MKQRGCLEMKSITTECQRHQGAVIASQEYKDQYCEEKIRIWKVGNRTALKRVSLTQRTLSS